MNISIRKMLKSDIIDLHDEFLAQGWHKEIAVLGKYYIEQEKGLRKVFVAECGGLPIGYATLLPKDSNGPFADKNIPTVCDFNVFKKYQGQGAGSLIMDAIEADVMEYSDVICLGVGLHKGYGAAQRLYIKRGYIPDGSGVWYNDKNLEEYTDCKNDDGLNLFLSKKLK